MIVQLSGLKFQLLGQKKNEAWLDFSPFVYGRAYTPD